MNGTFPDSGMSPASVAPHSHIHAPGPSNHVAAPGALAAGAPRPIIESAAALLIFAATVAFTIYSCRAMSGGMTMPGGWVMSMAWMPMPGQTLFAFAAMFVAMWTAMMVAMMLPSSLPMILIYLRVVRQREMPHPRQRAILMAGGYFGIWAALGLVAFAGGVAVARAAMAWPGVSRAVPWAGGLALVAAGIYQWTPLKRSCLQHCRDPISTVADHLHGGRWGALHMGLHHGFFCAVCCWSLMAIQLVLGIMNIPVMILIALVIALEKLVPIGPAIARVAGGIAVAAGIYMVIAAIR